MAGWARWVLAVPAAVGLWLLVSGVTVSTQLVVGMAQLGGLAIVVGLVGSFVCAVALVACGAVVAPSHKEVAAALCCAVWALSTWVATAALREHGFTQGGAVLYGVNVLAGMAGVVVALRMARGEFLKRLSVLVGISNYRAFLLGYPLKALSWATWTVPLTWGVYYCFHIVHSRFGFVGAVICVIAAPATLILTPWYALVALRTWMPLLAVYGGAIAALVFGGVADLLLAEPWSSSKTALRDLEPHLGVRLADE